MAAFQRVDPSMAVHLNSAMAAGSVSTDIRVAEIPDNGAFAYHLWPLEDGCVRLGTFRVVEHLGRIIVGMIAVLKPLVCFNNDWLFTI